MPCSCVCSVSLIRDRECGGCRQLLKGALRWRLVRAPSYKAGAVPKAVAGDMIITHLDHEFRFQRLPFGGSFVAPSAGSAWGVAGKSRRRNEFFQTLGQGGLFGLRQRGGEPDMM